MATSINLLKVVNAVKRHTATLFFFHGSGSTGNDVKKWIDILNKKELNFPHIKIIYPTAPVQLYTPNNGMASNVWFDRKDISIYAPEIVDSIDSMCHKTMKLIEQEVENGILYNRIIVCGFSMGGALAMHLAYRYKPTLAGCVAMSSFLNKNSAIYQHLKEHHANAQPPLLQFHGTADELIPIEWGEETYKNLKQLGINVTFIPLKDTSHELIATEIQHFKEWVLRILPDV